ncbi:MAG: DUF4965 domain-containing protein, partial [Clostridia bacterium]|nr:DUF4965 domain-containing protein [Clostridia bacterium]
WGYLHLAHENADVMNQNHRYVVLGCKPGLKERDLWTGEPQPAFVCPVLCATSQKLSDRFILGYDDIHSVEYFGEPLDAFYKSVYGSFDAMFRKAVEDADDLYRETLAYDEKLMKDLEPFGAAYACVGALAYRQAVAAHKLVCKDGKMLFLSKECFSNGCMATLDVTYPSVPLFLLYNPELVRGMMRPIFDYAATKEWEGQPYAPHDCGQYPLCNGQVYGVKDGKVLFDRQMPVEECGNAILVMAALDAAEPGNRGFLEENKEVLAAWADYLAKNGYNPENQLCTDDFAGYLARNCNLSLKAIVALGAYGKLFDAPEYTRLAEEFAGRWVNDAKVKGNPGSELTFDYPGSWSLKYNMVWDKLLHLGL